MKSNIQSIIRSLCFLITLFVLPNEIGANFDTLNQIWTKIDQPDTTRFRAIREYYTNNVYSQPDSVICLSSYHLQLAQEKHSQEEEASALEYRAKAYLLRGDYDNALIDMNKAVDIFTALKDSIGMVHNYNNLAVIHTNRSEYREGIEYFSKCLAFYQANNIRHAQAAVLVNLGLIQLNINNYDFALEDLYKALDLYEALERENEITIDNQIGIIWLNIGSAHLKIGNHQQALKDNQKALRVFQAREQQFYIAHSYTSYARIHKELNQIDSSLYYLEKSIDIHRAIGNEQLILKDQVLFAHLILPTDLNRATTIGEEVLKKSAGLRDHIMKIELYDLLYKCYKKKNNYSLSISMLEKYNDYTDSLRMEQDLLGVTEKAIQTRYETELLNARLKNEVAHSQLKLTQSKVNYTLIFIGSSVLLCVILYSIAKRVILNKQKKVLSKKFDRLKKIEDSRNIIVQSDKMASLGQLTAGVAHEINNPVNFISNGVVGLKNTLNAYINDPKDKVNSELVKDMKDMITAIEEGAKRTSGIVKSLQLFSREGTENYIETDIISELESTFRLLSNKLKNGIELERYYDKNPMHIFCYPGQLNQVFMNIVLNAVQAVKETGMIKVAVKEENNNVVISISDDGPGIPDDTKQKIFEPFYTTKNVQEGTGLGLSITFGIIKKHNGSIDVIDNNPRGTKFVITLPKRDESLITQRGAKTNQA